MCSYFTHLIEFCPYCFIKKKKKWKAEVESIGLINNINEVGAKKPQQMLTRIKQIVLQWMPDVLPLQAPYPECSLPGLPRDSLPHQLPKSLLTAQYITGLP